MMMQEPLDVVQLSSCSSSEIDVKDKLEGMRILVSY